VALAVAAAAFLILGTGGVIALVEIVAADSGPYEVKVIDFETGEPAKDAFVLVSTYYDPAYGLTPQKTTAGRWGVFTLDRQGKVLLPEPIAREQALMLIAWSPGSTPMIRGWHESSAAQRVVDAFQHLVTTRTTQAPAESEERAWPISLELHPESWHRPYFARLRVEWVQRALARCPGDLMVTDSRALASFESALGGSRQALLARAPQKGTTIRYYERPRGSVRIVVLDARGQEPLSGALVRVESSAPVSRFEQETWEKGPATLLLTDACGRVAVPAALNRFGGVTVSVWAPGHTSLRIYRLDERWHTRGLFVPFDHESWTVRNPTELEARLPGLHADSKPEDLEKCRQAAIGIRGDVRRWRRRAERGKGTEHPESRLIDPEVDRLIRRGEELVRHRSNAPP